MARQSKHDRVLQEREARLEIEHREAQALVDRAAAELRLIRDIRKSLAALPKRASRAKRVQAVVAASMSDGKASAA